MAINVLIVDDSQLIRQVVRKVVRQAGLAVDQFFDAANGQDALKILKENTIHLVLSDINMPVMDGLQLLMHLRQLDQYQNLPVIMVSTEGSQERMQEAMDLGASGYVLKPFTPERLVEQLRPLNLLPSSGQVQEGTIDLSDPNAF